MTNFVRIIKGTPKPIVTGAPRSPMAAIVVGAAALALAIAAYVVIERSGVFLSAEYREVYRESAEENASDYGWALTEIRDLIDDRFHPDIDEAVDELTGIGTSIKLTYCIAKDKLKGTDTAREMIDAVLYRHFSGPSIETLKAVEMEMRSLADQLAGNTDSMGRKIGLDTAYDADFARFHTLVEESGEVLRSIAVSSTLSGMALTMTAAMSPAIIAQARNVLGAVATRVAKTQTTSAIFAVADGPFPIGDAVALAVEFVGTGLAVRDLYKARKMLRKEVRPALREGVSAYREDLYRKSREITRKMITNADGANLKILTQMS